MKKKAVMLVLAAVAIVSLVVVGFAVKPMALAKADEVKKKDVIEWTGQAAFKAQWPMFESLRRTCERINMASGGRLELTVEPQGSLCPVDTEFEGVHGGVIDFGVSGTQFWGELPARELFSSRCAGMSPLGKWLWMVSGGGAALAQEMLVGSDVYLIPGGMYWGTAELFLQSISAINAVADLQALKGIRAAGEGTQILRDMGANAFFLEGGADAIRDAIENEEIDAFEYSSPWVNWEAGFQDLANYVYVSECRAPQQWFHFIVNETRWNELPDDLKTIVQEISKDESIISYERQCQLEIEALSKFVGYGCVVERLSPDIEAEFIRLANEYYDEKALENEFYAEVLQSLRDFEEGLEVIISYDEQSQEISSL